MNIIEILKKSILYPTTDIKKYLLFGVLVVLANLSIFTGPIYKSGLPIIGIIISLVAFVFYLLISGFDISVIKEGINRTNEIPGIDFAKQVGNGIKSIILAVIFFIIPLIISIVLAFIMGLPQQIAEFSNAFQTTIQTTGSNGTVTPFNPTVLTGIPNANTVFTLLGILAIITIILVIIFGIFLTIGKCRLAKYDSLKAALNIHESFEDLRKIGIGKYIITYFLMAVIIFAVLFVCEIILGLIGSLIMSISPLTAFYTVAFLSFLIINPFLYLFQGQTLGLLYSETE